MGGRGGSSMSAVRKAKGHVRSVAKSDEQRLEQMGRIMEKTARDRVAYSQGMPGASKFKADAYAAVLPQYQKLRSQKPPRSKAARPRRSSTRTERRRRVTLRLRATSERRSANRRPF